MTVQSRVSTSKRTPTLQTGNLKTRAPNVWLCTQHSILIMTFTKNSELFICCWGRFLIGFDFLPCPFLQPPAPPPPPCRSSRMISKPTASTSLIGARKPKYVTHHEHQKAILLRLTEISSNTLIYCLSALTKVISHPSNAGLQRHNGTDAVEIRKHPSDLVVRRTRWIWAASLSAFLLHGVSVNLSTSVGPFSFSPLQSSSKCSLVYVVARIISTGA